MSISVVVTVRNEAETIDDLVRSLLGQTRPPEEIVFTDGGSTDQTVTRLRHWITRGAPIRLLECPGANIAAGRNRAIEAAQTDLIACTDAGVSLDPRWLERIVAPFASGADVVMGFFQSAPRNAFELALGATTLPDVDEIDPDRFIPSSRSIAFRRSAWERVAGYPEWLDYCEDVVFDLALRRAGYRFAWVPDAVVYFRPRPSVSAFFRQYYRYARGDGKANLWPRRHLIRYLTYALGPLVTLGGFWYKRFWFGLAVAAVFYLLAPYRRLVRATAASRREKVLAALLVPVLRLVGDVAKMLGYPVGVDWRARRRGRLPPPTGET
jgi:glycosyltransferase involved in cell wall biosynthesis